MDPANSANSANSAGGIGEDLAFIAASRSPQCTLRLDKHLVGYFTIQFMDTGSVDLAYDDRWQHLDSGRGWFWPAYPGPRLRFHPAPGCPSWSHRHVGFQGPRVQRWITEGLWPSVAQPAPAERDRAQWAEFFDRLQTQSARTDRWGQRRAVHLLEEILISLAEARARETAAHPAWLTAALDTLDSLAEEGVFAPDYPALAAHLGLGTSTLRRDFKAATGLSPHAYVLQARLARARTLLGGTDLPLSAVAERLGYGSVYFFARQFRERVGMTPGAFRRSRAL